MIAAAELGRCRTWSRASYSSAECSRAVRQFSEEYQAAEAADYYAAQAAAAESDEAAPTASAPSAAVV